jgi:hypothetical protein
MRGTTLIDGDYSTLGRLSLRPLRTSQPILFLFCEAGHPSWSPQTLAHPLTDDPNPSTDACPALVRAERRIKRLNNALREAEFRADYIANEGKMWELQYKRL